MREINIRGRRDGVIVNIAGNHEYPGIWDSVYYFQLSDYPNITDWEIKKLIQFINYEKINNRETEFVCEDNNIIQVINQALATPELYLSIKKPSIITECFVIRNTDCKQKGCLTDYVYHGTGIENAKSILKCGKILSAVKAKGKTAQELAD